MPQLDRRRFLAGAGAAAGAAALRTLAVGALVLLLVNPSRTGRVAPTPPTVLLDASLSMSAAGGRWHAALDTARALAGGDGVILRFGTHVTPFDTLAPVDGATRLADALRIANDTLYGLGAGVWTRNGNLAYRMGRAIKAGRVWTNCYHLYPAGAAFGGYKISGVGRENHRMMLEHYSQTKNLLVSYSPEPLGFF